MMTTRSTLHITLSFLVLMGGAAAAAEPAPKFEHQTIDTIQIGYGVAIGDVDGDKKDDILLADKKAFVWYRNPGTRKAEWKRFVLAEDLTPRDNVCIAARDIDGDGKVEIAVGAMWNPGETTDAEKSGSVHYLLRPDDPTQKWKPVKLHHEPTVHRMNWVQVEDGKFQLIVLPLHGRGNRGGSGAGVKVLGYVVPEDLSGPWETVLVDDSMHMAHNFEVIEHSRFSGIVVAGKEGLRVARYKNGKWSSSAPPPHIRHAAGEVRALPAKNDETHNYVATIEPMHGNAVVVYSGKGSDSEPQRTVLDESFAQGHAVAVADLLGRGRPQVVAGWRNPNKDKKVGIKMYVPLDDDFSKFETHVVDDNQMACEDLKVADLDGDGRLDIIAAGRATKNLKIYWNVDVVEQAE